jgi:hypothetical protein
MVLDFTDPLSCPRDAALAQPSQRPGARRDIVFPARATRRAPACRSRMDREQSVLTSLRELQAIDHQRQLDHHTAAEAARLARAEARAAAEVAARAAAAEAARAAEAAALAAEQRRADAERAERVQLETAAATERARELASLAHHQRLEELAVQREVARRQRPRWMIAVTTLATLAALALAAFALDRAGDTRTALAARDRALAARDHAVADAAAAQRELAALGHQLADLEARIDRAVAQLEVTRTAAAARAAQADLERLRAERAALAARQHQRDAERLRRERLQPVDVSADCLANVICK